MSLRILLADDHQMFREALRILLEQRAGCKVVAETGDGLQVLALIRDTAPDIVCLDIEMPGMKGIEITRLITAAFPAVKVIALSTFCDQGYVKDMLDAGAQGYVTKTGAGAELLRAIETVQQNRTFLCPVAIDALRAQASVPEVDKSSPAVKLGAREIQVLKLVAVGMTSGQIAEQLAIALSTVEVHRRNIMRKLGVDNAVGLTRYAIRTGIVPNQ